MSAKKGGKSLSVCLCSTNAMRFICSRDCEKCERENEKKKKWENEKRFSIN